LAIASVSQATIQVNQASRGQSLGNLAQLRPVPGEKTTQRPVSDEVFHSGSPALVAVPMGRYLTTNDALVFKELVAHRHRFRENCAGNGQNSRSRVSARPNHPPAARGRALLVVTSATRGLRS
jgi:hypothetical protein